MFYALLNEILFEKKKKCASSQFFVYRKKRTAEERKLIGAFAVEIFQQWLQVIRSQIDLNQLLTQVNTQNLLFFENISFKLEINLGLIFNENQTEMLFDLMN